MITIPYEVEESLKSGMYHKNYRFDVLEDDGIVAFTIDNDTLVSESVKIDERMSSGKDLKFGLCEGSSLEFQYFDHPNINGKEVQAFLDVEYEHTAQDEPIYYDTISQQGVSRFTPYIFADAHTYQLKITEGDDKILLVKVLDTQGNIIDTCEVPQLSERTMEVAVPVGGRIEVEMPYDPEELLYVTIEITYTTSDPVKTLEWYTIPMGRYTVEKCPIQVATGIHKVTAYNKLMSDYLDAKANNNIISLVDEGELGISGSLSYHKLLEKLLYGYRIEAQNVSTAAATSSSNVTMHNTYTVDHFSLYTLGMLVHYDGTDLLEGEYYNFRINAKAIFDAIADHYNYRTRYVTVNGREMSMYDYCLSNYGGSENFGGVIQILVNQSTVLSKGFAKYWRDTGNDIFETGFITSSSYKLQIFVILPGTNYDNYYAAGNPELDHLILSNIEKKRIDSATAQAFADVTIRDLQSAVYELSCLYGQLDRETDLFYGVELGSGTPAQVDANGYSKFWMDEGGAQKFKYLIITYKGLDGQGNETDYTLQRTVNGDGTVNYNMSDNWLFRNLVWTAAEVGAYADAMVAKMQNIEWMPFEMWGAGLPQVETGDAIVATDRDGNTYESYIMQRQLNGIQNLEDTYINGELEVF